MAALKGFIRGKEAELGIATTPPLQALASTTIDSVWLRSNVKRAPGLAELLESSGTLRHLHLPSLSLLERAPRSSRLESLTIEGAATRSLDVLAGMPALVELKVGTRQTMLADFDGIGACPNLVRLKAKQHRARSIAPLAALAKLEEFVGPEAKQLSSLEGLSQATLRHVDVNLTPIRDLDPLGNARGLLALKLRGAKVTSLEPILACSKLQTLYAERSSLESVDGLGKRLAELRLLWIGDTRVSSLAGLAGLDQLLDLDLTGLKRVRDFTPLARLRRLRYLNLFDTAFDALEILEALPALVQVQLGRSRVPAKDARVKKLHAALKKRDRRGGVLFAPTGAATSLSNSQAAYCSLAYDDASRHNCF